MVTEVSRASTRACAHRPASAPFVRQVAACHDCARRRGSTLLEALVALMLVAFVAVALASAEAWANRATATAEAQEDAATAAELVLDSLAQVAEPASGSAELDGVSLAWTVEPGRGQALLRLRARTPARSVVIDEEFTTVWAPPPSPLEAGP